MFQIMLSNNPLLKTWNSTGWTFDFKIILQNSACYWQFLETNWWTTALNIDNLADFCPLNKNYTFLKKVFDLIFCRTNDTNISCHIKSLQKILMFEKVNLDYDFLIVRPIVVNFNCALKLFCFGIFR